ncbi:MAG: hypothetical protein AAFU54_16000 [Chloroflexota bacterium]
MPSIDDTQPNSPFDTQPKPPSQAHQSQAADSTGPGCMAWGLLGTAGGAFSLMVVVIAGLAGYLVGEGEVGTLVEATRDSQISEYLTDIPQQVSSGNTGFIEGYIDWFSQLTPEPPELAMIVATGTQLAVDLQPTVTPTATVTPTTAPTEVVPTTAPTLVPTQALVAEPDDAPLFDAGELFAEAQAQFSAGEFEEAAKTLDAVMAVDPQFRAAEVESLMLQSLTRQAELLLRSGDPGNLSAGIVKANEAAAFGDIGELSYESYIAGLYLNAQSQEGQNLPGAIEGYSAVFAQAPNYLDVRQRIFDLRVELGDLYYNAFDFCPAVVQYQNALQLFARADVQTKLDAALSSCPDAGAGAVGSTSGTVPPPASSGDATVDEPVAEPTSEGVAPIGQR